MNENYKNRTHASLETSNVNKNFKKSNQKVGVTFQRYENLNENCELEFLQRETSDIQQYQNRSDCVTKLPLHNANGKLILKLNAAKISLRTQTEINKSITTTESQPPALLTPQKKQRRALNFSIAPNHQRLPNDEDDDDNDGKQLTDITQTSVPVPPPLPPPPPPLPAPPLPNSTASVIGSLKKPLTAEVNTKLRDSLDSNESNSQPCGGSSTSPESILDNILSAASSVSVRSSSSDSTVGGASTVGIKPPPPLPLMSTAIIDKTTNKKFLAARYTKKIMPNNRLLTLKTPTTTTTNDGASPTLHVMPPTPSSPAALGAISNTESVEHMLHVPQTLQLPLTPEISEIGTPTRSRSPSPTPSISIRVTSDNSMFPDDLKCTICLDVFNDPRTLNCLHSFCFQCLIDENFQQDANQWSITQSDMNEELNGTNRSNYSLRSSTPDIPLPGPELATVSAARQRGSSFSLRRKKSMDKILAKSKSELKASSVCSSNTQLTSFMQEKPRCIACHNCKFVTQLPVGGLRQLPQNYLLVRKIEELKLQAGDEVISRVWCSLCIEETNAIYHCVTCTLNLCTLCKEAHERQRNTANHRMKSVIELRRARKQKQCALNDNTKFVLKCGVHPGFDLKTFCVTCLQLACADCLVLLHKNHKHETISKAINQYAKVVRDSAEQTRPLCNYAEHSIERLNEIAKSINRKCDEVQAEVDSFMNNYFEAVEVHRKTLLQQVARARESKVEMIIEQQLELEKRTQEAMEAVRFGQELTDFASDTEILSFVSVLIKRFEYCQKFKTPVDPKISDSLHFLSTIRAPTTKSQFDIPLYGIITMQTVEPSLCTLQWEGFSQLRLHKKADLILQTRDADGVALCHGGLQINAMTKYKEANQKFLPVEISDFRDGTYCVSFTPDSQGTILLTVTINDKPIKGTPFTFLARQVRPHSGIFHCCTFCSSKGNKQAKCYCEGRMPGYNGCGHGHAGHPGRRHWSCCGNVLENSECNVANKLLNT